MAVTKEDIQARLKQVVHPRLNVDLVSLDMVKNIAVCEGIANVQLIAGNQPQPVLDAVAQAAQSAVESMDGIKRVNVEYMDAKRSPQQPAEPQEAQQQAAPPNGQPSPQQAAQDQNPLPNVKNIIAVGAGKGGVGKSTVSVNLAIGLARAGARVGLLDGDIYGPSAPTLLGLQDDDVRGTQENFYPFEKHGIKTTTMGKLVDPDEPLIWRGPMAHGAFRDLAMRTLWGDLDYLIVDLPPGTGDVPLTLAQMLPLTGAIIVCTPQRVAQDDARRAAKMFTKLGVDVLGVVENMSYFIGDDGKEYDIFGRGGAERMAEELGLPVLGAIPIHMELRANSDNGEPHQNFEGNPTLTQEIEALVNTARSAIDDVADAAEVPTLSIS